MNRSMRRASKANGRQMMKKGWSAWEDWTARASGGLVFSKVPAGLQRFWKNNLYTVQEFHKESEWGLVVHLMVRRNDEGPVREWSDLQRIKNELSGVDRIAVEVFPRESQLVDQANIYHLWVLPAGMYLPFGLHQ